MTKRYLVLFTMEDGLEITLKDEHEIEIMLNNEEDEHNFHFVTEQELEEKRYSEDWNWEKTTDVLIVKIEDIIIPITKTTAWRLPH